MTNTLANLVVTDTNSAIPGLNVSGKPSTHLAIIQRTGGNPSNGNVLLVTGSDSGTDEEPMDTTVGISDYTLGKGTVKIVHNRPTNGATNADGNASALSLRCNGEGTEAQGIFLDYEDGVAAVVKMLNLRCAGVEKLTAKTDGSLKLAGPLGVNGANPSKPTVSGSRSDGSALDSLIMAFEAMGLITDGTTA